MAGKEGERESYSEHSGTKYSASNNHAILNPAAADPAVSHRGLPHLHLDSLQPAREVAFKLLHGEEVAAIAASSLEVPPRLSQLFSRYLCKEACTLLPGPTRDHKRVGTATQLLSGQDVLTWTAPTKDFLPAAVVAAGLGRQHVCDA